MRVIASIVVRGRPAIQIRLPATVIIGFVYSPRPVAMAHLAANALIQNKRLPLDPAPDGHMVHTVVPLGDDFLQIARANIEGTSECTAG